MNSTEILNPPRHVAIIMDGNNRWAKKRLLPGIAGHRAGVEAVRRVVEACDEHGIEVLTLFAFSSENWQRPEEEVRGLMGLFLQMLKKETRRLHKNRIRLKVLGDLSAFSEEIQQHIREAEALTAENSRVTLAIAANYGGQWDIAQAAQQLAVKVKAGELEPGQITPELIQDHLYTAGLPLPDLCIRTGGDHRISNFMLWQFAYAELYFTSTLWPDFDAAQLREALVDFSGRQRRFGKTSEQVEG
ncbi:di-trans,poly-cis-decaprenylcistransferase [Aestuariirhabdus litorea]|uniref:Ditrans,polycis-undecaprenyl-diphosphate synthase ((2E,6E)-farnesyl-diphosphate specific) n=2 Tax=Aestuariirhabdus litorea TaxID=2528527 RepID=A0A3P3VU14_9GAMM|nr:di-trans,poly-cis-decaprenylcistransferase [Aestuariirhabdus litorea]RWW98715.1 di-trans,poly-cis-decaprenylcistransferase [Endozoicomonadaceae bacterium GTF-13]